MGLYAAAPGLRTRQILADVGMLVWTWAFVRLGRFVHDAVAGLAAPGRALERAGRELSGGALRGAGVADDVPVIGDALRRPFEAVASGGRSLVDAGLSQQESVGRLALVLGLLVAVLPIAWLAGRWLPWRLHWWRESRAVTALLAGPGGTALLAHRALTRQDIRRLRAAEPDPWAAFAEGRHDRLATLEMEALGLRAPETPPA